MLLNQMKAHTKGNKHLKGKAAEIKGHLQEASDFQLHTNAFLELLLLLQLVLKGGRQHVGKQPERHGQQELHKGDGQEDQHGDHAEDIRCRPRQLPPLAPVKTQHT